MSAMNNHSPLFYCGLGERRWNHHPVAPGRYACVSPVNLCNGKQRRVYVTVPDGTRVIQDSGAFCDSPQNRLSFRAALDRQIEHAERNNYASLITHRASYDLLIDEKWNGTVRYKKRWTVQEAESAVDETVNAASFLARHRGDVDLILSAQGVDAAQYLACVRRIIPLLDVDRDMLGLGGWCIVGKMRARMLPVFQRAMWETIPYTARCGVRRVHVWGVIFPVALGQLLWLCDEHDIALSTDSVGPQVRVCLGAWGYGDWIDHDYQRPAPDTRGLERARHVKATRAWLSRLRETKYYKQPPYPPRQLFLM